MMDKKRFEENSNAFWNAMESSDEKGMRECSDPNCRFTHIGITCGLDQEISFYTSGTFQPTNITFHSKDIRTYDELGIVLTDCDYSLLLDGKETTHHFMVTEVYDKKYKLVQFSFTALVY